MNTRLYDLDRAYHLLTAEEQDEYEEEIEAYDTRELQREYEHDRIREFNRGREGR